jgi:phosphoribosylaminoimidazole-succinocarboxamide synthase
VISEKDLFEQLSYTIKDIELSYANKASGGKISSTKISGKVRDSYIIGDKRILVASDRLSAFDRVLTTIPFKGELLTKLALFWFEKTAHIVPNHIISNPHPNIVVSHQLEIIPIEVVVRGYLAGSAWRDYERNHLISGYRLPRGLKKYEKLETALVTPSTKELPGVHDQPISHDEIIKKGIVTKELWEEICSYALDLFQFGTEEVAKRGLILVDTKYEFGILRAADGREQIYLADEIHTQDSSRYWLSDSYQQAMEEGVDPVMLDKEFVRRWLIERNFLGDGTPPEIPDSFRVETAQQYIRVYEQITGSTFKVTKDKTGSRLAEIEAVLEQLLS